MQWLHPLHFALQGKKPAKIGRQRAQKLATTAKAGDAEEGFREPYPSLADGSAAAETSSGTAPEPKSVQAGFVASEPATDTSGGASQDQPEGRLCGGCEPDDSAESSITSLGGGLGASDAGTNASAQLACPQTCSLAGALQSSGEPSETSVANEEVSDMLLPQRPKLSTDGNSAHTSLPGHVAQSDTCVSRDVDTLTMNAGEHTGFPPSAGATVGHAGRQSLLASGQPASHRHKVTHPSSPAPGMCECMRDFHIYTDKINVCSLSDNVQLM